MVSFLVYYAQLERGKAVCGVRLCDSVAIGEVTKTAALVRAAVSKLRACTTIFLKDSVPSKRDYT